MKEEERVIEWSLGVTIIRPNVPKYTWTFIDKEPEKKFPVHNVALGIMISVCVCLVSGGLGLLLPPLAFPMGMFVGCAGFFTFMEMKK